MNIKLDALENAPLTIQQCHNVCNNINDILYQLIDEDENGDEDDQLKTMIHYLSCVMDKLETLKHLDDELTRNLN